MSRISYKRRKISRKQISYSYLSREKYIHWFFFCKIKNTSCHVHCGGSPPQTAHRPPDLCTQNLVGTQTWSVSTRTLRTKGKAITWFETPIRILQANTKQRVLLEKCKQFIQTRFKINLPEPIAVGGSCEQSHCSPLFFFFFFLFLFSRFLC